MVSLALVAVDRALSLCAHSRRRSFLVLSLTPVNIPKGFPLESRDHAGQSIGAGDMVKILSVESCARDLPQSDQERLFSLVGTCRPIVEFDAYGFAWLSFTAGGAADFCLFPNELAKEPGSKV